MKRAILAALAFIIVVSGCQAVIDFAPVSPLPTSMPVELHTQLDAYQLFGNRAVNVTCLHRQVVIVEQRPDRIMVGCHGPTPTAEIPVATLTPTIELPTVTPTPTEVLSMTTFTSQPDGTAGVDTFVSEAAPDTASGTNVNLTTHSLAGARRITMLLFDVSSLAGSTVNSATLYLYNSASVATTYTFELNSILVANSGWVEGATWNYANPSTVRWAGDTGANGGSDAGASVGGTDYNATALGTFTYTASTAADTEHAVALNTAQVQAWVDGANYGGVLRRTDALSGTFNFRSSDYATDTTKRPKLVVEYTEAGGDQAARILEIGGQLGVVQYPAGGAGLIVLN